MINLDDTSLTIIKTILKAHIPNETVWLFGSRLQKTVKPHADIDLAIINTKPIPTLTMALLEDAFSESTLPYKVDIVEWTSLDESFKKIIASHYEKIQG